MNADEARIISLWDLPYAFTVINAARRGLLTYGEARTLVFLRAATRRSEGR